MSRGLDATAHVACLDVVAHIRRKARPREIALNEGLGALLTWMPRKDRVVMGREDVGPEWKRDIEDCADDWTRQELAEGPVALIEGLDISI